MSGNDFLVKPDSIVTSSVSKMKVTAVKFINKYLYVGIGGNLNVYNIDCDYNYVLLLKQNVLNFNNVYGIFADGFENNVALHGGKLLRVLPLYPAEWPDELPWKAKDWIWHAMWLNDNTIALVLGHNELLIFRWRDKTTLKLISCEEKCILYSGLVVGDDLYNNLVVLSGTVYKEVLIWAPALYEDQSNKTIIHRLKGHNGVLFSVNYDVKSKKICSTSDDRTIRIWKINLPPVLQNSSDISDNNILSLSEWKTAVIEPLYCVFGHSARVFRSCMISDNRIITIGEDSYLCVWNAEGENILKQETHQGGTVCCLDYCEELKVAATGGADGGISLWPIPEKSLDNLNDDKSSLVPPPVVPSRIKLLKNNRAVITGRNSSSLYIYNEHNWLNFFDDIRVLNYCLLEVSPCRSFVSLATIQGYVIIFKEMIDGNLLKIVDEKVLDGKIFSLHWLTNRLLLCCGNDGVLTVFELTTEEDNINLLLKREFLLPLSKERWLTSAILYYNSRDNIGIANNQTLICGDRCGSIHVYSMQQISRESLQTLHRIHGRLGVTCIYSYDDYIWSTGRDGCLRQFTLDRSNDCEDFILTSVSVDKLALPWGAKIIHSDFLGILVLGFHEVDLVIWSVKSRVALRRIECGGGHREWDCSISNDSNEICFYYLKDKNVNFIFKKLKFLACPPILDGFHPQDVNALSLLSYIKTDCYPDGSIFVSGGEDTTVRVSFVSDSLWKPIILLTGHLSSIRTIATLNIDGSDSDFSRFLVFTAGGRAQLKIWSIDFSNANPFDMKGGERCTHMLKDGEKIKRPWREALPTVDPETRYMDLSVEYNFEHDDRKSIYIFAVCSDGYLRVFGYGILTNKLEIVYSFEYGRCLLKTLTANYQEISVKSDVTNINEKFNKVITAITTSTDGKMAFWNITKELPVFVLKVHQSGINSCDMFILDSFENSNGCKFVIASGGDDCSVIINLFFIENEVASFCDNILVNTGCKLQTLSSWSSSALHSSQITGIKIWENLIVTVGIDQRINVLFWNVDSKSNLIVNYFTQYMSVVADIHGIEIWRKNKTSVAVCVFGVGVEIIDFDVDKLPDSPGGMHFFRGHT